MGQSPGIILEGTRSLRRGGGGTSSTFRTPALTLGRSAGSLAPQAAWGKTPPRRLAGLRLAKRRPPTPERLSCRPAFWERAGGRRAALRAGRRPRREPDRGERGLPGRVVGGRAGAWGTTLPSGPRASPLPAAPPRPAVRAPGAVTLCLSARPRPAAPAVASPSPAGLPRSLGGPCQAARRGLLNIHEARGAGGRAGSGGWLTRPLPP